MPRLEADHIAWELVRAYIAQHGDASADLARTEKAPLSVLVQYELQRLGLSYSRAARLFYIPPTLQGGEEPIQAGGLYHLVMVAKNYTATPNALGCLSRGFGWDLRWLRIINGETVPPDKESVHVEIADLVQELVGHPRLADLMRVGRRLGPDRLLAVLTFAEHLIALQPEDLQAADSQV